MKIEKDTLIYLHSELEYVWKYLLPYVSMVDSTYRSEYQDQLNRIYNLVQELDQIINPED